MKTANLMIKKLEWDTHFFGYPVGKIDFRSDYDEKKLIEVLNKESNYYKIIYIFIPEGKWINKKYLVDNNILFVDSKVTYDKLISTDFKFEKRDEYNIKTIHGSEYYNELQNLALLSGMFSRFRRDKNFSDADFEALYKNWLLNSLNGSIADIVFISQNPKGVVNGFITGRQYDDFVNIGLIAVDPAFYGQGIGKQLIYAIEDFALNQKLNKVLVTTQLDNKVACKFYERNGFNKFEIANVYHKWSTN